MNTNTITPMETLPVPMGNAETAARLCAYINKRKDEIALAVRAVEVTPENYNSAEIKQALADLKAAIEDLREKGKKLVADACAATDAQRVLSQIDTRLWSFKAKPDPLCAYAVLDREYKALKAKVDEIKAANEPPAPTHTYIIRMTATDGALGKVLKEAEKQGAADVCYAAAQSDKAVKQIAKWFEENV